MAKAPSTYDELLGYADLPDDQGEKDVEFTQLLSDLKDTFGTPHGKRTLLWFVNHTFQRNSPMTGNSQTYYNLGTMDFIRSVLNVIAIADQDVYMWLHAQQSNELRNRYLDRITDAINRRPES